MSLVSLKKCSSYDPKAVAASIEQIIEELGGIGKFIKPGDKVLIKPNLLTSATPDKAVTTHPEIIRAVTRQVLDAGGKPFISDSPAIKGFKKVIKDCGVEDVAKELGVPIHALGESVTHKTGDKKIFRFLEISRHVLEADKIVNLPKLKTHSMMLMTMAVKNIFGCVVGARKGQWHLKAGTDSYFFAKMLVELYDAVSPDLNIIDGILAMEGDGPGSAGRPKRCGVLAGSSDGVALDRVMLELAGVKPSKLPTNRVAQEMGIGESDLNSIELTGDGINSFQIEKFDLPAITELFPAPKFVKKMMTDHMTTRPLEDRKLCILCDECLDACPTDVIASDDGKLSFSYDNCIRCYCCLEVCPEGAIYPYKPLLLKIIG